MGVCLLKAKFTQDSIQDIKIHSSLTEQTEDNSTEGNI